MIYEGGAFETEQFHLIKYDESVEHTSGWRAIAKPGFKRYELSCTINGLPVLYLKNTFEGFEGEEIDINGMDTSNVIDMSEMFKGSKLKKINLSQINVKNVRTIQGMFYGCTELEDIIFGEQKFKTIMADLAFFNCYKLEYLDLSSVSFRYLINSIRIINSCENLKIVKFGHIGGMDLVGFKKWLYGTDKLNCIVTDYPGQANRLKEAFGFDIIHSDKDISMENLSNLVLKSKLLGKPRVVVLNRR